MTKWKKVTEAEFREYIKAYPRPLKFDVCAIYEPPLAAYYDPTLGKWPKGMVASYYADGGYGPPMGPNGWRIKEET